MAFAYNPPKRSLVCCKGYRMVEGHNKEYWRDPELQYPNPKNLTHMSTPLPNFQDNNNTYFNMYFSLNHYVSLPTRLQIVFNPPFLDCMDHLHL